MYRKGVLAFLFTRVTGFILINILGPDWGSSRSGFLFRGHFMPFKETMKSKAPFLHFIPRGCIVPPGGEREALKPGVVVVHGQECVSRVVATLGFSMAEAQEQIRVSSGSRTI